MIKANELLIGNRFLLNGENDIVTGIWHELSDREGEIDYYIQASNRLDYSINECEPISLTPEILKKYGFVERADTGLYSMPKKNFYLHHYSLMDDEYCFRYNDYKSYPIRYLHQLQNLYFTLTGEELELNEAMA